MNDMIPRMMTTESVQLCERERGLKYSIVLVLHMDGQLK